MASDQRDVKAAQEFLAAVGKRTWFKSDSTAHETLRKLGRIERRRGFPGIFTPEDLRRARND